MENDEEERLAESMANHFLFRVKRNPWFRLWGWFLDELASWYFAFGSADFRIGDWQRAEKNFYTAWQLNRRNELAGEWFWYLRNQRTQSISRTECNPEDQFFDSGG